MALSEQEKVAIIRRELAAAEGHDWDELSERRAAALDYYYGRMAAPAAEGNSSIVSTDVADVVHAALAQFVESISSLDVSFEATGQQDEDQAQMETDAVRFLVDRNNGWQLLTDAAFDGLLQATAWVYVNIENFEAEETRTFGPVEPGGMAQLNEQYPAGDMKIIESGDAGVVVEVTTRQAVQRPVVRCVPPENMVHSADHGQYDVQSLRFIAERRLYSEGELQAMGLTDEDIDRIPNYTIEQWPAHARRGIDASWSNEEDGQQPATTLKETFICYHKMDVQENGQWEKFRFHIGGDVLISEKRVHLTPYAYGSPIRVPHKINGRGMYDVMRDIQLGKTHILREYMDNLTLMNASRLGYVAGAVNEDDLHSGNINGTVRMKSPDAIVPLPSNDIGGQAVGGLDYLDKVRTSRGGQALDLTRGEMQIASSSAAAAVGEFDSKERMAVWYARNLMQSVVRETFLLLHEVLRRYWRGPMEVKRSGQWIQTVPAEWPARDCAKVDGALSQREIAQKKADLQLVIQAQIELIQAGFGNGVLTDVNKLHRAYAEYLRLARVGCPEEFLIDPQLPESQQAQQASQQQASAQQQQAQQLAEREFRIREAEVGVKERELELERYKFDRELAYKYHDTAATAATKEAEMTIGAIQEAARDQEATAATDEEMMQ